MTTHERITSIAQQFRNGKPVVLTQCPDGQSLKLFHRSLWRMAKRLGYRWKFRDYGDGLTLKVTQ